MAAADVFVLPSLFEGLPLALLEAMAAGLPVVGTRVCGAADVVVDQRTGAVVPPGDPDALAAAVSELLAAPALARAWGERGQQRLYARYTADRTAHAVDAVYREARRASPARSPDGFPSRTGG
jgi:glycosyltransferase involved in cell wall biosynthesis